MSCRLERADRQRRRRVAGRGDAGVADFVVLRVAAPVAGRGHDDDAGANGALDRLDQRVGRRRFVDRMAERQVDDVDAERRLVGDREVDGANHVAGAALAGAVEDLQPDQARAPAQRRDSALPDAPLPAIRPATCVPCP